MNTRDNINSIPILYSKICKLSKEIQKIQPHTPSYSGEDTFESVSKNIKSFPYTLNYTGENLTSIVYRTDRGTITKTFNYTGENLTSIVLSGDTPSGIALNKTLSYTTTADGDEILTQITYT